MGETLGKIAGVGMLALVLIGCRAPQPDLKPPTEPEALRVPPSEARFNSSTYPKEAFLTRDRDPLKKPGDIVPAQGFGVGGPSGGPGGYR